MGLGFRLSRVFGVLRLGFRLSRVLGVLRLGFRLSRVLGVFAFRVEGFQGLGFWV